MKYIVWVKEERDGPWRPNGDGPLTVRQAQRIADEIRRECGCRAKFCSVGYDPNPLGEPVA